MYRVLKGKIIILNFLKKEGLMEDGVTYSEQKFWTELLNLIYKDKVRFQLESIRVTK